MVHPLVLLPALFSHTLSISMLHPTPTPMNGRDVWIDFGRIEIGDSNSESVDLVNWSTQPIRVLDVDVSGDDAFQVNDSDCDGVTLERGESCEIEIHFEPEEVGEFSGEVEVETDLGDVEIRFEGEAVQESF